MQQTTIDPTAPITNPLPVAHYRALMRAQVKRNSRWDTYTFSRLTPAQVERITHLRSDGIPAKEIALGYDISRSWVQRIGQGLGPVRFRVVR